MKACIYPASASCPTKNSIFRRASTSSREPTNPENPQYADSSDSCFTDFPQSQTRKSVPSAGGIPVRRARSRFPRTESGIASSARSSVSPPPTASPPTVKNAPYTMRTPISSVSKGNRPARCFSAYPAPFSIVPSISAKRRTPALAVTSSARRRKTFYSPPMRASTQRKRLRSSIPQECSCCIKTDGAEKSRSWKAPATKRRKSWKPL